MDKKILAGIVDSIVKNVAAKHGIDEGMARGLVGFALQKNAEAIANLVSIGTLGAAATAAN